MEPENAGSIDGDGILATMEALPDEELEAQRGTFAIAGMDVRLGAEMRTYMNGELVLHTVVNWDNAGVRTTQNYSGALTPTGLDALRAGVAGTSAIQHGSAVAHNPIYLTNGGQTALSQSTDGAIQNILVNTASNIAITQETTATIDLDGYSGFQSDILNARMVDAISGAMGASALSAMGQ